MIKLTTFISLFLFPTLLGCYSKPPTEFGKQTLQRIEAEKHKIGTYPATIEGNMSDRGYTKIEANDFFYIVDSTRTSFTLKVFNQDGLADIYDSKTGKWTRTDK